MSQKILFFTLILTSIFAFFATSLVASGEPEHLNSCVGNQNIANQPRCVELLPQEEVTFVIGVWAGLVVLSFQKNDYERVTSSADREKWNKRDAKDNSKKTFNVNAPEFSPNQSLPQHYTSSSALYSSAPCNQTYPSCSLVQSVYYHQYPLVDNYYFVPHY